MRTRRGFSLVEMMVAMTITMMVFAITLPFVRVQTRSLGSTAGRLDADQVARFAMRAIEQDLRRAAGEYGQPTIVAAGPLLLSFNANIRRSDALDVTALENEVVGYEAGAAWPLSRAANIPTTMIVYPTADYVNSDGVTTRTETITYYLVADTESAIADTYILYRQFNDQTPLELIDGLYLPGTPVFFTYFRNESGYLTEMSDVSVMTWTSPEMAELRTIGLRASGIFVNKYDGSETIRTIETRVTLPVSLATKAVVCGPAVTDPATGSATASPSPRGVTLSWVKSTQDTGEPEDAQSYIVKRQVGAGAWQVVATIPASGSNSYSLLDSAIRVTGLVTYVVSVVGCDGLQTAGKNLGSVTL